MPCFSTRGKVMDDDLPEVIVCAGPPICLLMGDAAIENAKAGCPHCRHIVMHHDGEEVEYRKPTN